MSQAALFGDRAQRITITPDATALANAGLTTASITQALKSNGVLLASGDITQNGKTLVVQSGRQLMLDITVGF